MSKSILISLSSPTSPDHDEEFNLWFNDVHGPEAVQLDGIRSVTRYRIVTQAVPPKEVPDHRYLAIYELDDLQKGINALEQGAENFAVTDCFDADSAAGFFVEQIFTNKVEHDLEANKAVVRKLIDALGKFDEEGFLGLLTDDVMFETPGQFPLAGTKTKAEIAMEFPAMKETIPNGVEFTIHTMTAEEDRVHVELSGKSKTIDGVDYNNRYHYAVIIRNGKVASFRDYLDSDLAMKVFGPVFEKHGAVNFGR